MNKPASIFNRFFSWLGGETIARVVSERVSLAVKSLDDFRDRALSGEGTSRDRRAYDRQSVLADALDAWRFNPLARRIVSLTSEYVVGGELEIQSDHSETHAFLQEWWHHRLNRMPTRAFEWCDELTRTGELFPLLSTDAVGMTYVRAIPAADIGDIETAANDIEQEQLFFPVGAEVDESKKPWLAYDEVNDAPDDHGVFQSVMLHYAINRPVGGAHGEPDLAPVLKWLTRYAAWLEDRVRLNHFRQAFLFIVRKPFADVQERLTRQAELNANPPNPGSILVTSDDETWDVIHPKLDSFEAGADGMAIKKMIAVGGGVPLHYIAEPESATRTTAEQAGDPTYRHFERRQIFFLWLLSDLARIAVRRRAMIDSSVNPKAKIWARGTDIFSRDNASLATATTTVIAGFAQLRDRGVIDDAEFVRMAYKFAGELVDVKAVIEAGHAAGIPASVPNTPAGVKLPPQVTKP